MRAGSGGDLPNHTDPFILPCLLNLSLFRNFNQLVLLSSLLCDWVLMHHRYSSLLDLHRTTRFGSHPVSLANLRRATSAWLLPILVRAQRGVLNSVVNNVIDLHLKHLELQRFDFLIFLSLHWTIFPPKFSIVEFFSGFTKTLVNLMLNTNFRHSHCVSGTMLWNDLFSHTAE